MQTVHLFTVNILCRHVCYLSADIMCSLECVNNKDSHQLIADELFDKFRKIDEINSGVHLISSSYRRMNECGASCYLSGRFYLPAAAAVI